MKPFPLEFKLEFIGLPHLNILSQLVIPPPSLAVGPAPSERQEEMEYPTSSASKSFTSGWPPQRRTYLAYKPTSGSFSDGT